MKLKRQLAVVHRWLGLAVALFLALQALTGLALVYRTSLVAAVEPAASYELDPGPMPMLDRMAGKLSTLYPEHRLTRIAYPAQPDHPFIVYLATPDSASVQRIVGVRIEGEQLHLTSDTVPAIFDFLFRVHHTLLIAVPTGRYLIGAVGLLLISMVLTGLIAWWPGVRRLSRSLAVHKYRHPVAFFWQLHRTVGVLIAVLVLAVGTTGAALSFEPELRRAFGEHPVPGSDQAVDDSRCSVVPLQEQVAAASAYFPGAAVRDVRFDAESGSLSRVLLVNATTVGVGPPHQVWLEPCSTRVTGLAPAPPGTGAEAMLAWAYPLHTGMAFGTVGKAVALLGGFGLLLSLATGLILWASRRRRKGLRSG